MEEGSTPEVPSSNPATEPTTTTASVPALASETEPTPLEQTGPESSGTENADLTTSLPVQTQNSSVLEESKDEEGKGTSHPIESEETGPSGSEPGLKPETPHVAETEAKSTPQLNELQASVDDGAGNSETGPADERHEEVKEEAKEDDKENVKDEVKGDGTESIAPSEGGKGEDGGFTSEPGLGPVLESASKHASQSGLDLLKSSGLSTEKSQVAEPVASEAVTPPAAAVTKADDMAPASTSSSEAPVPIESPPHPKQEVPSESYTEDAPTARLCLLDRKEHIAKIKAAYVLRETLRSQNLMLQSKISEFFRKRRADEKNVESEKSVVDQDKRYASIMVNYKQIQNSQEELKRNNAIMEGELRTKLLEKSVEVKEKADELRKFRRQVSLGSEHSRTGKTIPIKVLEQMEALEEKKEQSVALVRLENIKLRNKLKRHEYVLRQKEELAEGLHLIDFEQLKIENQTYNEKIEERNEELLKLRKKITNVVQVLAHIKEKLEFVQTENKDLDATLRDLEVYVSKERDSLPQAKQKRDALRKSNIFLKQKHGLLGNDPLLRDYEDRVDDCEALEKEIRRLEEVYEKIGAHTRLLALEAQNKRRLPQLMELS